MGSRVQGDHIVMLSKWSGKVLADALLALDQKQITLGDLGSRLNEAHQTAAATQYTQAAKFAADLS